MQFFDIDLALFKLIIGFLPTRFGQAIDDEKLVVAYIVVHPLFDSANVPVEGGRRLRFQLSGARRHLNRRGENPKHQENPSQPKDTIGMIGEDHIHVLAGSRRVREIS